MLVPTTPTIPTAPIYGALRSPTSAQLAGAVGESVIGTGIAAYELSQARKPIDYITSGYGLAGAIFAGTPLGPYLQGFGMILGLSEGLSQYYKGQAKKRQVKRDIRNLSRTLHIYTSEGHNPGVAATVALMGIGTKKLHEYGLWSTAIESPFWPSGQGALEAFQRTFPGASRADYRRLTTGMLLDPETGRFEDLATLKAKYGRSLAQAIEFDLFTRVAPGRGLVPPPLARYRRAA